MQSCELVATITAIACAIANNYTEEEITVLASAFNQLGDTLGTIIAQEACITSIYNSNQNGSSENSCEYKSSDKDTCLKDSNNDTKCKNNSNI